MFGCLALMDCEKIAIMLRSFPLKLEWNNPMCIHENELDHFGWNEVAHSGQNKMVHSILARMKWSIPFQPEWNDPFPFRPEWTGSFWLDWNGSFHSGQNEMFIPWTQIRNMRPAFIPFLRTKEWNQHMFLFVKNQSQIQEQAALEVSNIIRFC